MFDNVLNSLLFHVVISGRDLKSKDADGKYIQCSPLMCVFDSIGVGFDIIKCYFFLFIVLRQE